MYEDFSFSERTGQYSYEASPCSKLLTMVLSSNHVGSLHRAFMGASKRGGTLCLKGLPSQLYGKNKLAFEGNTSGEGTETQNFLRDNLGEILALGFLQSPCIS